MRALQPTRRRPRTPCSSAQGLATLFAVIRNDVIPFVGRGARDEGNDWFSVAHVEDFMWDAGFDENEIAGFVFQHLFASIAEFVTHFSFDDVENYFEIDVDVRVSDAARRNSRDIGR